MHNNPVIDEEQRLKAIETTDKNIAVIAGAGTGKTSILIDRIIYLLKKGFADIEEIVAMTFTEKAALEMSMRLRYKLIDELESENNDDKEKSRIKKALSNFDIAIISTIHSFAFSIIKEKPLETGLGFDIKIMDEFTRQELLHDVFEQWFKKVQKTHNDIINEIFELNLNIEDIKNTMLKMEETRDLVPYMGVEYKPLDLKSEFMLFYKEVEKLFKFANEKCIDEEDKLFQLIKSYKKDLDRISSVENIESEFKNYILDFKAKGRKISGKTGNKENWLDDGKSWVLENCNEIKKLTESDSKKLICVDITHKLIFLLKDFIKDFRTEKLKRGLLDYSDMLIMARDILRDNKNVRKFYHNKFKYILIDEFQDTDPLQVEIVFYLAEDSSSGFTDRWDEIKLRDGVLFIVGDPKQSIYHFRRADLAIYEKVLDILKENAYIIELRQNFRSQKEIVDFTNFIFSSIFDKFERDSISKINYLPLHHYEELRLKEDKRRVIQVYPSKEDLENMSVVGDARKIEADYIARLVKWMVEVERFEIYDKSLSKLRPVKYNDIALLYSRNTGMEIFQETFDDYGIPYNFRKQQRTFHGFLAGAIMSLLRSIAFPFDKISLVSALKSPLFGLTNEELLDYRLEGGRFDYIKEQYPVNSVINSAFEILREMYFKKRDRKNSEILMDIYTKLDIFQIIQLWSDDEEYMDILVSILEIAKRYEKEYSGDMADFINWFDELLYSVEAKRTEIDLLPFDEGRNKLQCITIHSAKGLEFPVVFLSNLCNKTTSSNPDIKDFLNKEFEFNIKGSFQTYKYDELKEAEHTIEYEEEIRLLYVAMTRARDFLIIPVFYPQNFLNNDEISLKNDIQLKILEDYINLYSFSDTSDYEQQLNIGKFINERYIIEPDFISSINKKESKPVYEKNIENSKNVVSDYLSERENFINTKNSLLKLGNISLDAVSVTELEGDFLFRGGEKEGKQIGEIFHKVIEKIDLKSPDNYRELIESFCKIEGNEHLLSIIIELVEKTIESSIIKRVSQADFHYKEVPISYLLEDKIISGKIDLIFNEKDNFIIVDFKTDNVSDDEWNRRLEHYNTQIQYYKKGFEIITSKKVKETIIYNPLFE